MLSKEDNERLTRVGPGTPMGRYLRRFWLPILLPEELPAPDCPPVRVRLLGEDLVAFRDTNDRYGLLGAYCPHRRAHLYFGRNEECGLRCVYHGWKFDVDGNCVDMPTEPEESSFKDRVKIKAYLLREHGGVLWAYLGERDRAPGLPLVPFSQVPATHRFAIKRFQETNYLQALEGGIDSAHTRYLHTTLEFYRRSEAYQERVRPLLERYLKDHESLNPNELDLLFRTQDKAPRVMAKRTEYGLVVAARASVEPTTYYWRFNQFMTPFYTMPPRDPGGHAFVPIDDEHTWVWTFRVSPDKPLAAEEIRGMRTGTIDGRFGAPVDKHFMPLANKANEFGLDRELQRTYNFTGIIGTGNQDMAIQVSMGPIVDRTQEHLGVTDVGIIEARKLLLKALRDLEQGIEPFEALHPEVYDGVHGLSLMRPRDVTLDECYEEVKVRIERMKDRFRQLRERAASRAVEAVVAPTAR